MYFSLFLQRSKYFVNWFFLLSDNNETGGVPQWRVSSLRIILFCSLLQCLFSTYITYNRAIEFNILYIVMTSIAFLSFTLVTFILSYRFYKFSAHLFLTSIVASSITIDVLTMTTELAHAGYVLMYASPIISLMLLGYRVALFYMVLNILPFYLLTNDVDLFYPSDFAIQLPNAMLRINSLVFVFFNIIIPLVLIRIIVAAKRINQIHLSSNKLLQDKNDLYRDFFTDTDHAKIIIDNDGYVIDCNHSATDLFNLPNLRNSSTDSNQLLTSLIPSLPSIVCHKNDDVIQYKDVYLRVTCQKSKSANYFVYQFNNCTNEQNLKIGLFEMEQENKRLKYSDNVMGLPNRYWFESKISRFMLNNKKRAYVVIVENIDNEYLQLKYGKDAIKNSLVNAYKQLKDNFSGVLLPSYIGNQQLAFLINDITKVELEDKLLKQIKPILDGESPVSNNQLQQSFKFGFAYHDYQTGSCSKTIANALTAINHTNKYQYINSYSQKLSKNLLEKHEISILLDEALENNGLEMHYQPKVLACGSCIGFEALARWNNAVMGNVSPGVFIPIAEEYGMINRLTDSVIRSVCQQISDWEKQGITIVPVAINLSFFDFNPKNFISKLVQHLIDFNVKPEQIEIEITETSFATNAGYLNLINSLQALGFVISIDDFGVGYSNLSRIADYPIDKLKVDRSLISQLTTSERKKALVKTIHDLCETLNIKCIAEGVETQEQVNIMSNMGCQEFQGFYFSKPLSSEQCLDYLNEINNSSLK